MRRIRSSLGLLLVTAALWAAPVFPKLTGRVVDQAGMLGAAAERTLTAQLAAHENATGNQVVVVTLKDLGGYSIEEYGYRLGRHWGIGQKGQDNGVLLLVAKSERKVRIEVGYGLEGKLTDAISSNIIHTVIRPAFRAGRFAQGIQGGVTAIIQALGGQYKMQQRTRSRGGRGIGIGLVIFLILLGIILSSIFPGGRGGGYRRRPGLGTGLAAGFLLGRSGFGSGGFGGGFGGGGFGGGGGGLGGGGASGGW